MANGVALDALRTRAAHVAFEDLTGIRARISTLPKYQQWMFKRIYQYVAYKLEAFGVTVAQVDAAYSSQACSRTDCACVAGANRDGKDFECVACGYAVDADYNAAKNVAYRYAREVFYGHELGDDKQWFDTVTVSERGVLSKPTSSAGRATSHLALKSGIVTLDGEVVRQDWPHPASPSSPTSPALNEASGSPDPERTRAE